MTKWTPIAAMLCITALLITALALGIDGVLLTAGIAIISGIGGHEVHKLWK